MVHITPAHLDREYTGQNARTKVVGQSRDNVAPSIHMSTVSFYYQTPKLLLNNRPISTE